MPVKIETDPGTKPFTYSAVGIVYEAEKFQVVNASGFCTAGCQEYARRFGIINLRKAYPNVEVQTAAAWLIEPEKLELVDLP